MVSTGFCFVPVSYSSQKVNFNVIKMPFLFLKVSILSVILEREQKGPVITPGRKGCRQTYRCHGDEFDLCFSLPLDIFLIKTSGGIFKYTSKSFLKKSPKVPIIFSTSGREKEETGIASSER